MKKRNDLSTNLKQNCNIFQQQIHNLIKNNGIDNIIIVPIEIAKNNFKAKITTFWAEEIMSEKEYKQNKQGLNEIIKNIEEAKKKTKVKIVILGIESSGHYHQNISYYLTRRQYYLYIINGYATSLERKKSLSSTKTDSRDLNTIVEVLKSGYGLSELKRNDIYLQMRKVARQRRKTIGDLSKIKIEIRRLTDIIFFGMDNDIFSDFWSDSVIWLLKNYPSPVKIRRLGFEKLRELSKKHNLKFRDAAIKKLIEAAKNTLSLPQKELIFEYKQLKEYLKQLESTKKLIEKYEKEMEYYLVQTEGILLLSIPHIAVISATEFISETGKISEYKSANAIIKLAGTEPIIYQSGKKM